MRFTKVFLALFMIHESASQIQHIFCDNGFGSVGRVTFHHFLLVFEKDEL